MYTKAYDIRRKNLGGKYLFPGTRYATLAACGQLLKRMPAFRGTTLNRSTLISKRLPSKTKVNTYISTTITLSTIDRAFAVVKPRLLRVENKSNKRCRI